MLVGLHVAARRAAVELWWPLVTSGKSLGVVAADLCTVAPRACHLTPTRNPCLQCSNADSRMRARPVGCALRAPRHGARYAAQNGGASPWQQGYQGLLGQRGCLQ